MSDRLTTVEEKIAYLEQYVGELDGVVREMHDNLTAVQREMRQLKAQLEQGPETDDSDDPEAHKPPHY